MYGQRKTHCHDGSVIRNDWFATSRDDVTVLGVQTA